MRKLSLLLAVLLIIASTGAWAKSKTGGVSDDVVTAVDIPFDEFGRPKPRN